jgi:hypothetical protein
MIRDDSRHRITPKETWIEEELQERSKLDGDVVGGEFRPKKGEGGG